MACTNWILNPLRKARDQTMSSWILGRFISTESWWEFPLYFKYIMLLPSGLQIFCWKVADILIGVVSYLTCCFSLGASNILSLALIFAILIVSQYGPFWVDTVESLCASWTWISVSFARLRNFSAIMTSNKLSAPFSLSSPSRTPIMLMLVWLLLF